MDQRTCIKFCMKNKIKCANAFRMLTVAYGEATLDRSNVYRWYKMFSEGREDVNDEVRAGRPSTSTTNEKINEVEKMILANRRITVREVAEDLNISIGSCHSIFMNDLGLRRVAAKFMLDSVRDDPNLLQRVITGDKAWVYGYDVETKAQSSQWKLPHEPRPKKARQARSNVKVLLTVFFDCRGVVHHEFLPQDRTDHQFIPPSLRIKDPVRNPFSEKITKKYQWDLLESRIQGCHSNIRIISKTVKGLIFHIQQLLPIGEFTEVIMSITRDIQHREKILTGRQQTKMSYWVKKYQFPQSAAFPNNSSNGIVNLSSIPLSEKEERVLALGLHYVPPDKPDIPRLIAGVEGALKNLNHMETLRIRHAVTQVLRRPYHPVPYARDHRSLIQKLKKTSSLVITKADKGNQTVLMDRADYEGKMMNILADTSTFTNISTSAKDAMVKGYKSSLRNLMKAKQITKEQLTQFTGSLTRDAYIYGAPKIHKPGVPLRPIIAYHLSPAHTLAKYLAQLLSPIMKNNPNQYNITHPPSFVQEVTQMQPPAHHIMVSFDVTALYLSLPHALILNKLQSFLKSAGIQDQTINLITQLTSLCLSISTFTFNHQHYKQIRGTPMGSPLSSIVAEVVMGSLDQWINQTHSSDIHYWRRYVDDIFCIIKPNELQPILNTLHSFHADIKFTYETETNLVLPFLDILIIRTPHRLHTAVYYKNNIPPLYTHFSSNSPVAYKSSLLTSIFSFSVAISRILRPYGIQVYFNSPPNLAALLRNPITKADAPNNPIHSTGAVYAVSCQDCPASYVGETGRTAAKRQVTKQIMGDLPMHRIVKSNPFTKIRIYFAGPSIMVSFDVTSLYLSLAHPLIINSLRTFLENAPLLDTLTAETVVELTSICLGMSTFTFDTQFFKQTKGSPMGSPLSTVVAEVVMRSLDQWITSRHSSDIFLWRRYIDDTFCLVSEVSASHILSDLNSFHPDIAFTHETENHSVLPFLDTLVIRTPSSFHTSVYYKNNTPPHHTNFRSHCPTPHKINTVRALTKRIFTHCSLPLFQTIEKAKIFSYLSKSGYPTPFILKHMHDPHHNSAPAIHRNICSLPFCPQSITIARFLRQHGITTYFQNPPNIATLIRHPITRSSLHASSLRSGGAVYSVSCDQCNATYVGETEPDMEDKSSWEICSDKNEAFVIIITTLTNEQAGMFIGETNAKKVWDSLRKTYTGNLEDKIIDKGLELKNIKMKGGSKYFLVIVDDYSRRIFVYFLRSRDETFDKRSGLHHQPTTTKSIKHHTPMQRWNGRKRSVKHIRISGCLTHWLESKPRRNRFSPKGRKGIFIGYSIKRKAYRIYDIMTKRIHEIRSVKFSEDKRGIDYENDIQEDTNCDNLTYKGNERKMRSQEDTSVKPGGDCDNHSLQPELIEERCVKRGRKKRETKSILEERHKARLEKQERKLIEEGVRRSQRIKDRNEANLIIEIDHYISENFKEAMDSGERNEWLKAMEEELSEIEKHKVWTLVPRKNGMKVINSKWVYNDHIIAATSKKINDNLVSEIEKYVTLTEKKDNEPFIGIEIKRAEDGFYLSQTHYIDTILHRFGLEECNSVQTPGDQNQNLDEYLDSKPVDKTSTGYNLRSKEKKSSQDTGIVEQKKSDDDEQVKLDLKEEFGATLLNILNSQQRMINKLLELQLGVGQERIPAARMDIEKFNGRNREFSIWTTNFEILCENNNWKSCRTRINGMRAHLEDTALAWTLWKHFKKTPISKYDKAIKWQYRIGSYVDYFSKKLRLLQLGLPGAPEKVLITGILHGLPVEMQQRLAVTQFATLMELRKVLERHRPCVECVDLELEIDSHKIKVTAIVLEDMPFEILIGKPTMKKFRIKWDFGTDDIRRFSLRSREVVATIDDLRTKFPELCHTSKKKFPKSEVDFLPNPNNNIVACKPYPMSDHKRRWTAGKIEELLARGIITRSNSEYASPCILVLRRILLIDPFFLDPFPFPRIDTITNQFGGCQYFTKIDLKDSFWQVGLTKATRRFSAFATPDGLYEFTRLPFGWKNSPPKFQRVISEILDDLLEREWSSTLMISVVFNMTVNLDKCHICVAEVELLGRVINGNSKQMKEEVIENAKLMKRPYDLKSLQCFTGFTGHFRAYIPNYSKIVRPLDILKKKYSVFMWSLSTECEEAYLKLIDIITSKPILAIPDESLPYELSTDASYYGTGAVLYQRDVNKKKPHQLRVIRYYSYTFSRAEQNYSITEKECLAVLKAVKHLRFYLEGKPFVVHTDNRALTQLLSCGHLRDRLARWQLFLSSFEMKVNHRSGRELSDADALSRLAIEIPNDNSQAVLFLKHQSIPLKLENYNKYFVPDEHRTSLLSLYHDDPLSGGHSGFWRTYYKMKQRFSWRGMKNDIRKYVASCPTCQNIKFKYRCRPSRMSLPSQSRVTYHTVHIDFAEAPSGVKDKKNLHFYWLLMRPPEAAVRYHNRSYNSYLGCSPLFKFTGTSPVLPADKELDLQCDLHETEKTPTEQNQYRQRTKLYFNRRNKTTPPELKIGDFILVRHQRVGKEWHQTGLIE
ncbi:K02A2.6-like [Cordylochernes scorpioides]|uniref:K02A2.6-like n=1 Tax=Cordylochernes scorpioides TaxID=51811 RepID=A0ABY6KVJ7_9ARAC|nr:K02A2.6-like [Cordylochernes scorpioides]